MKKNVSKKKELVKKTDSTPSNIVEDPKIVALIERATAPNKSYSQRVMVMEQMLFELQLKVFSNIPDDWEKVDKKMSLQIIKSITELNKSILDIKRFSNEISGTSDEEKESQVRDFIQAKFKSVLSVIEPYPDLLERVNEELNF